MYSTTSLKTLLQLLLYPQVVRVTTFLLSAILCTRMQTCVAFATDHFIAVVFLCEQTQTGFDNSTSQSQDEMKSRLLLNVVIAQGSPVFELFASENQTLLIRWNSFFVLNLSFDIVNGITWLDLKCDRLTRQSFDKNLHLVLTLVLYLNISDYM